MPFSGQFVFLLSVRDSLKKKPLGDGLERRQRYLVRLVSLNEVQPVLSHICDYRPLSVNTIRTSNESTKALNAQRNVT